MILNQIPVENDQGHAPAQRARHVVFAWPYTQWGGAQIYILSIIRNAPKNWRFTLLIPRNSREDLIRFFEPCGVELDYMDGSVFEGVVDTFGSKIKRQWRRIASEVVMYRRLTKYDPSETVIHIDAAPWQSWVLLSRLTRKFNVFFTLHNAMASTEISTWRARIWRWRMSFLMGRKRFHAFAANINAIESTGPYLDKAKMSEIILTRAAINPIEINEVLEKDIDIAALRKKHGIPADKFMVLSMGQFIDRKGRWVFLEAARRIVNDHDDAVFVWIGPNKPDEEETARIVSFGLENAFYFIKSSDIGSSRIDVLSFLRATDVFALPSLWEGLPISILEAMALRVPTISTRVNAIPEAIIDGETGLLVEPGDGAGLAEAIIRLKNDSKLRQYLSNWGRVAVLRDFDERETSRIAVEAYEKALNAHG